MLAITTRLQLRAARLLHNEQGQTSSEYLVIAGVVVLVIIGILKAFGGELSSAASAISKNIMDAVK